MQNVFRPLKITLGLSFNCKIICQWLSRWQALATQATSVQLCFKVKRKLLEHHIIPDNNHASISSHLHSEIGKNCWHSRAANHIRTSSLPRDSPLITVRNLDANYFRSQIKKIKKYKQAMTKNPDLACSFIICLQNGNLLEVFSPFIHHKYTEITYFSFKGFPP